MYKSIIISTILSVLGIEIVSTLALKSSFVPDIYAQKGITRPIHMTNQGLNWRTENRPWGTWHKRNDTDLHTKSCFNVLYQSNNIGARDIEDYNNSFSWNSIIALGDSFIEGYGLNQVDTFTSTLQKLLSRKVFNLGSSNNFGPLQYYLIYKEIGSKLPHDTVILGFLPSNDFEDNDLNLMSYFGENRYRPYYNINDAKNKYPIIYSKNAIKSNKLGRYGIKQFIQSQSIRINSFRLYKNLRMIGLFPPKPKARKAPYYKASIKQQDAAIYYVKKTYQLAKTNGIKKFIVLGIPTLEDFDFINGNYSSRIVPKWEQDLKDIDRKNKDFLYVDGFWVGQTDEMEINYKQLFQTCDPHWSPLGASRTAELIKDQLRQH